MPWFLPAGDARRQSVPPVLLVFGLCGAMALAQETPKPPQPDLLTNLVELRSWANQQAGPALVHPCRIVAEVLDADKAAGVLALRDASGVEFIQLDLKGQDVEAGATMCLELKGCRVKPKDFGLAVVPSLVVDNDGEHMVMARSGTVFLPAGANPITVQWFNRFGSFALSLEYEGPNLPRQAIPGSVLSAVTKRPGKDAPHFSAGLNYRCYEGTWDYLPDFSRLDPLRVGVVTNFDLGVRTRNESVGLQFDGSITIPRDGAYTFYLASDDGSRLFVGEPFIRLSKSPQTEALSAALAPPNAHAWTNVEGTVSFAGVRGAGGELQLQSGNDEIRVDVLKGGGAAPPFPPRAKVRVSGLYQDALADDGSRIPGVLQVTSWKAVRPVPAAEVESTIMIDGQKPNSQSGLPSPEAPGSANCITTVAEVKALPFELAKRQLPVCIRGVVTSKLAVVQDATKGIFVSLDEIKEAEPLHVGDYCQIDGVTGPGLFAPLIIARRITHLGVGRLPQPLRATWDQLVNGSLDTQYAELDGVVTAVSGQQIVMLTHGGKIALGLSDYQPEDLAAYENALIRVRGCFFAPFNKQTRELKTETLRVVDVADSAVQILEPAPCHLFEVPQKSIGELLRYDPKATPSRLLKLSGQIIYAGTEQYSLFDGTNGMRVRTRMPQAVAIGDLVDAVGFLGLGGPAAELTEAVLRQKGHASLPQPKHLLPDRLLSARYDNTLVRVEATLMNQWSEAADNVLEVQSGFTAFRVRISNFGRAFSWPPAGSRLQLTGVYCPLGNRASDGTISSFELLAHSPLDIRVLANPPWWSLKRVLVLSGLLAALLCVALLWNKQLHHQVQERSRQLESEIRNRERAEQQRAAETDRARIARDLHDELGAGLTEVSLLASAGLGEMRAPDKSQDRFCTIAEKARALVSSLDVIVWAIDPKRNSLQSFADYLVSYAKELLTPSRVICRFKIPMECEAVGLPGTARHSLFLAIKEALNNVIRHASATEVELKMAQFDHSLEIVIADNGCGFDEHALRRRNGLINLQERLAALNGQCQIQSQPGAGTLVKFIVPLPHPD